MNQRQMQHYSQQVQNALMQLERADDLRMSSAQHLIKMIESKVQAIQSRDWNRGDELQELLTYVCLEKRSL